MEDDGDDFPGKENCTPLIHGGFCDRKPLIKVNCKVYRHIESMVLRFTVKEFGVLVEIAAFR
jgi:hypothetical protein